MPAIFRTPDLAHEEHAALARLDELRAELRLHVHDAPRQWVGSTRRALAARQVAGSTAIEGFAASVADALAAADDADMHTDAETEKAVRGYQRAMSYVLALATDPHFHYDTNLIRALHRIMTDGLADARPGLWRAGGVWVGRFEAPPVERVHPLVSELADQLNADRGATPALVLGAMAHLNLVMIHPFRDGNGRMSRCLQTLVIARDGMLAPEFSSIEEFLASSGPDWDNTADYFNVLREVGGTRWNPERSDALPWVRFVLRAHYIQAQSVLRRVREADATWRRITELRTGLNLPERTEAAIYEATIGERLQNADYRAALERSNGETVTVNTATRDLTAMVGHGLLVASGRNRGAAYVAGETLRALRRDIQADRKPFDTEHLFDG